MSKGPRRRPGAFCFVPQCCAIGSRNRLRRAGKGPPKIRSKIRHPLLFSPSSFSPEHRSCRSAVPCERGAPQQPAKDFLAIVDSILIALETLEPGQKKLLAPLI